MRKLVIVMENSFETRKHIKYKYQRRCQNKNNIEKQSTFFIGLSFKVLFVYAFLRFYG